MEYTKIPHLSFSRDMHNILNSSDYEHTLKQQFCCILNGMIQYTNNIIKTLKPPITPLKGTLHVGKH